MTSLTVFDQLVLHEFVSGLPAGWLHRLALHGRPVFHPAGHRLFHSDGPADNFWLLRSGVVALDFHVPGRGDILIEKLTSGALVGWSWLLEPHRWRFGAVVAEDIHAIAFDAAKVRALLASDPELGRELSNRLLAVVSDRLQAARHRLVELYAYPGT